MRKTIMKNLILKTRLLLSALVLTTFAASAYAAAPGITAPNSTFSLTAQAAYITQPDGQALYSWGYGCAADFTPGFSPSTITGTCGAMQIPGPTLIVKEGDVVTVTLTNNLPTSAGNTSILFPGFNVTASGGVGGLLTNEATPGGTVTYTFKATTPGTRSYYSGTQGDLQVEMGMYGAIIVLPQTAVSGSTCIGDFQTGNDAARGNFKETDFRNSTSAYDDPHTCYDREYLFQFSE